MGKRFDLNVIGSRKLMDLALKYRVRRLVVMSTFHIYGAHPHNHIPIYEDEPLRAGPAFPQIADAIQLDNQALTWIYRHPQVKTVLVRPCNVVGPSVRNAMSRLLRMNYIPVIAGFNPMVQFIHEEDLADALVTLMEGEPVGVYNVAGVGSLPWRDAAIIAGAREVPIPSSLARTYLSLAGAFSRALPTYLINFLMYPCVISDEAMRRDFGWAPKRGQAEAIRATVAVRT
jgi:UDP-glucose 4-epimerase